MLLEMKIDVEGLRFVLDDGERCGEAAAFVVRDGDRFNVVVPS